MFKSYKHIQLNNILSNLYFLFRHHKLLNLLHYTIFIFTDNNNMYRRHESLISQVTKTTDDVPVIVTRLASTEKNDVDYYPFSQVLRIRVLQVIY